jgi:hypothetical protein
VIHRIRTKTTYLFLSLLMMAVQLFSLASLHAVPSKDILPLYRLMTVVVMPMMAFYVYRFVKT